MIAKRLNSAVRLIFRFQRNFARNLKVLKQPKSPYDSLLQAAKKYDFEESTTIINEMEQKMNKESPIDYTLFLNNKVIVQFHLRQYGEAQMTLLNAINYYDANKLDLSESLPFRVRLVLLYMLYHTEKLENCKDSLVKLSAQFNQKEQQIIRYIEAIALISLKKPEESKAKLLQSLAIDDSELISESKEMCLSALLTILLANYRNMQTPKNDQSKAVFKMIATNKPVTMDFLKECEPNELFNQTVSYHISRKSKLARCNFDFDKIFDKITLLIAQNYFIEGSTIQGLRTLDLAPSESLHKTFVKASYHFDQGEYGKVCELLESKVASMGEKENLPEQDLIRYDALSLLSLTYRQQNNLKRSEQVQIDMDLLRFYNNVETDNPRIHYYNIPFREYFSFKCFEK